MKLLPKRTDTLGDHLSRLLIGLHGDVVVSLALVSLFILAIELCDLLVHTVDLSN